MTTKRFSHLFHSAFKKSDCDFSYPHLNFSKMVEGMSVDYVYSDCVFGSLFRASEFLEVF
jgi:hypothetical protein